MRPAEPNTPRAGHIFLSLLTFRILNLIRALPHILSQYGRPVNRSPGHLVVYARVAVDDQVHLSAWIRSRNRLRG